MNQDNENKFSGNFVQLNYNKNASINSAWVWMQERFECTEELKRGNLGWGNITMQNDYLKRVYRNWEWRIDILGIIWWEIKSNLERGNIIGVYRVTIAGNV